MKKILFLTTGLDTGGAEKMLLSLLSKINRNEFDPVVLSLITLGPISYSVKDLGIPVYSLGLEAGDIPNPNRLLELRKYIREIQPDLIQGWMYHGNLAASLSRNFLGRDIPIFWEIQHSIKSLSAERFVLRNIIKVGAKFAPKCKKIVFASHASKSQHEEIGYPATNSCVIPNGFNLEEFAPSLESKRKLRQELGLNEDAILIGNFARYHPMKDHKNLLETIALAVPKNPNLHFVLAGTKVSETNSELTNLIEQFQVSDRVHLLGERHDMPYLTPALDIATLSSAFGEAFPLVVGEAMSCQVPCVVTEVGDAGEVVSETGKVVPPRNPQALATAWQEVIDLGSEGREKLGIAARKRAMDNFSLEKVVAQYEDLWR